MPGRSSIPAKSDNLFGEVSARLPLFDDLPPNAIRHLTAPGFGRGFLTVSLRARLRKAGYRDLGHLAQTSPEAIATIRKFGPVRVERVRTSILNELARWLPGARDVHAASATDERRLARLRDMPAERLALAPEEIAALGFAGCSCADVASRSRLELLRSGLVIASDVDRITATLALFLAEDRPPLCPPLQAAIDTPAMETEARAAHRAALQAKQDREWEEAAPAGDERRSGTTRIGGHPVP